MVRRSPDPKGKLPTDMLRRYVFRRTGASDPSVLMGPSYGEDAAIIDLGRDLVLIAHSDPITGASKLVGWLAVNVACNDVAVRGIRPRWVLPVICFPKGSGEELVDEVTRQIDEAARQIGVAVVGGHSEFTPDFERTIITMTALGIGRKDSYVTTSGAKPGDLVLMTKTAAIEGTSILATDFEEELLRKGVSKSTLESAKEFIRRISVVREAMVLSSLGVNAMHDPTEGGIVGGLAELAYASKVRIVVEEERIPLADETREICDVLDVNPLRLISSGVLIASIPEDRAEEAINALRRKGIPASTIGRVERGVGLELIGEGGRIRRIGDFVEEELYKLF